MFVFRNPCARAMNGNRDFKIQDATASRTRWLINGLGLERRRLSGKSKVKIPVWMQDNAAAKCYLSVWFFGISFAEIAMARPRNALFCLFVFNRRIIVEEEFVLLYEAYRPSNLPFPHSAYEKLSLRIKTQPNVKPICEWKGIFLCFLTH